MTVTVRFAPSPTGQIHIGNARTALFNWLFARVNGGRFILRFDDTDTERSRTEYAMQIERDLRWLGIEPDAVIYQSKRSALHDAAADKLRQAGLLYPCFETAEELERRRKIRLSRRLPPVYGREALKLGEAEKAAYAREGRRPHWRFLLPNFGDDPFTTVRTDIAWNDLVRGPQTVDLASMSDPVLVREDGTYLYTLPSVADDIDTGITHIIRGDDHVTNTAAQIALFRALGAEVPAFGHHNLLTTISGEGLSKRSGALSIGYLREAGYEPMAVAALAVLIGTSESVRPVQSLEELAAIFRPENASRSAAKFDPMELDGLNHALLQALPHQVVRERLKAFGIPQSQADAFWSLVRGNVERFDEVSQWWRIVRDGPVTESELAPADAEFVRQAMELLPPEPWDDATWKQWTEAVRAKTGRKGKDLYLPLRIAITGRSSGPELAGLLPLLGREETLARRP